MLNTSVEGLSPTVEADSKQSEYLRPELFITANMLIGAVIGSASAYAALLETPGFFMPFTVSLAAIAGSAVGAAGGMLVGGLIDVVAGGSLDEK